MLQHGPRRRPSGTLPIHQKALSHNASVFPTHSTALHARGESVRESGTKPSPNESAVRTDHSSTRLDIGDRFCPSTGCCKLRPPRSPHPGTDSGRDSDAEYRLGRRGDASGPCAPLRPTTRRRTPGARSVLRTAMALAPGQLPHVNEGALRDDLEAMPTLEE